jgi:ComF family protein
MIVETFFRSILQPLKDFLFVTSCFHCRTPLKDGESRLCTDCWRSLTPVGSNDYTFHVLRGRFAENDYIADLISLYYFEKGKVLQSLMHSLKYEEVTSFGVELGERLGREIQKRGISSDFVIPVPLNKQKLRERGYNQSDFIAKGMSSVLGIPVRTDLVRRTRYTVTQTHLNALERKENVANAFELPHPEQIRLRSFFIVDDVITTGSTIQEIGKILKAAGAEKIIAASAGLAKLGEDG